MAQTLWLHTTVTLSGSAQELGAAIAATTNGTPVKICRMFQLQHDTGNTHALYIGGAGVTSSNWGVYLEAPVGSVPAAPWKPADGEMPAGTLSMEGLYVIGTGSEKLHVLWVPLV